MAGKKVIFIAGTSYSGSTLLDLILSNEERANSLGEVESIFNPVKGHHLREIKRLKEDPKWNFLLNQGSSKLYHEIFDLYDVDLIIDSSKNPVWIKEQISSLPSDVSYEVVLVFKKLEDFAASFLKRERGNWLNVYKNYHNLFFSLHRDFHRIAYHNIPLKDHQIYELLKALNLSSDEARFNFWKKKRTNFFGNNNANIAFNKSGNGESPKLVYKATNDLEIINQVNQLLQSDSELKAIEEFLSGELASDKRPVKGGFRNSFWFRKWIKQARVIKNRLKRIKD